MKIVEKLLLGFGAMLLLTGAVGALGFLGLSRVEQRTRKAFATNATLQQQLKRVRESLLEARSNEKEFLLSGDEQRVARLKALMAEVRAGCYGILSLSRAPEEVRRVHHIAAFADEYHKGFLLVADRMKQKGREDDGLVGQLKESVSACDEAIRQTRQKDLLIAWLTIRSLEKDYQLQGQAGSIGQARAAIDTLEILIGAASVPRASKGELKRLLDAHWDVFMQVVVLDAGIERFQGVYGTAAEVIEATLEETGAQGDQWASSTIAEMHEAFSRSGRLLLMALVLILAAGSVLALLLSRSFSRPLNSLAGAALRVAHGDLAQRVEVKGNDEVSYLASSFNQMVGDLKRLNESRLKTILDSLQPAVLIIDAETHVIADANPSAVEMMGLPKQRIVGRKCFEFQSCAAEGLCPITDQDREIRNAECMLQRADGSGIPILKTVVSVMLDGRQQLLETLVDISQQKWAETQLQRYASELEDRNEEVKQFAYIVSHDLRAPLVNLKGFSAELRTVLGEVDAFLNAALPSLGDKQREQLTVALKEDIPEALGFIDLSVTRMDRFIDAVLKLSRLGRRELKLERVDVRAIVEKTLETLAHQIEEHRATVTVGDLPEVVADQSSMEVIIGNMLSNAVKYLHLERPGRIEVSGEHDDHESTFSVRDNGRGIAAEDLDKVFAPFRRAGKEDVPGEGMGLSYVRSLVQRHGGRIWCDSEPGVGSTFAFTVSSHLTEGKANEPKAGRDDSPGGR